jgi:hypothetical protein
MSSHYSYDSIEEAMSWRHKCPLCKKNVETAQINIRPQIPLKIKGSKISFAKQQILPASFSCSSKIDPYHYTIALSIRANMTKKLVNKVVLLSEEIFFYSSKNRSYHVVNDFMKNQCIINTASSSDSGEETLKFPIIKDIRRANIMRKVQRAMILK